MEYSEIRDIIEKDYNDLEQTRKFIAMRGARGGMKTFYLDFSKALEELHQATSPFITNKEEFVEHIKYIESRCTRGVYRNILAYCHDKLDLNI